MGIGLTAVALLVAASILAATTAPSLQAAAPEEMVEIAAGAYPIGSDDGPTDERPRHAVTLAAFRIDRFEVTNGQFAAFLNSLLSSASAPNVQLVGAAAPGTADARVIRGRDAALLMENLGAPSDQTLVALNDAESRIGVGGGRLIAQPGFEQHPVNEVTWQGARRFCAWRGSRLPTEVEWEAAARGREGRVYPWGNDPPTAARAVYGRGSNQTEAVGRRPAGATPEGVHDLAGNIAEWTSTLYRPYPYRANDGREVPAPAGERVTRGGDHVFDSTPDKLRGAFRGGFSRAVRAGHRHIGFRCAR